jgi:selenocysteine-specific elongation factor
LRLLGVSELEPGQECFAQVFLNDAAVAVWNQPFVVRLQSPVVTIGGGRVLMPNAKRIKKATDLDLEMISDLTKMDPLTRASASVYLSDDLGWTPADLARSAGVVGFEEVFRQLKDSGDLIEVPISMNRSVKVHRSRFEHLADRLMKTLERLHRLQPLRFTHPRSALSVEFKYLDAAELLELVIEELKRQKKIIANVKSVGIVGYGPKLSKGQRALLGELIEIVRKSGLKVPAVTELESSAKKNKDSVRELLEMASENGDLLKITPEYFIHCEVVAETKRKLVEEIEAANGLTMSEIRQILDTSRKYAIPLCEYFDKTGFTKRDGDKRLLGAEGQP